MAEKRTKFYITVTPNNNSRRCYIMWGDGSRTFCDRQGVYSHEYENKTADYRCDIVNAYEFSIGYDDDEDYSKSMVESIPFLGDGLGRISDGLYSGSDIENLKIPDSVESIGASAFSGCTELETLNFPSSLSSLGKYAFDGCTKLHFTDIFGLSSTSLTSIPDACFRKCYSMNFFSIPQSVTTIGASAFYNTNLGFANFPKNLTDIGDYAFYFSNIRGELPDDTLYFDSHVNRIGNYAFYYFSNLKNIKAAKSVDYIGDHAFADCRYLSSIEFSGDVGTLACSCFTFEKESERYELKNVKFNKNVDTIGDFAFARHEGLKRIELPSGIRKIGNAAFSYCNALSVLQQEGVVANSLESIGASAFYSPGSMFHPITSFSVGDSLTSIGDNAFRSCSKLSSFNFGIGLKEIGDLSFAGCTNLLADNGKLICPENLIRIGEYAFTGCNSITSVDFNDALVEIPRNLFSDAYLVSVKIGNGVEFIGDGAFSDCNRLKTVNFGSSVKTIGSAAFYNCRMLDEVIMPNTVENIGQGAFRSNIALSSLHLSDSLVTISDNAFNGDRSLKSVNLPSSLTYIGKGAFGGASSISSIRIPDSVVEIGSSAFFRNYSLNDVSFGSSLTQIGDYAFMGASLSNLSLNEGLEKIGNYCFNGCGVAGGHVKIPSTVSSIGNYAFAGTKYDSMEMAANTLTELPLACFANSSIRVFTLPQSVTNIGKNCFASCRNMSSINIPSSLNKIGDGAFVYCSSLLYLKFQNTVAPSLGSNVFGYSGSVWQSTWAGYGVRGSNVITIPQNSSGYIKSDRTGAEPWLASLLTYGGFALEVENQS